MNLKKSFLGGYNKASVNALIEEHNKQIDTLMFFDLRLQFLNLSPHLLIRIFVDRGIRTLAATKSHDPDPPIFHDPAVDIDAALRGMSLIALVMVAGNIQQGTGNHSHQEREVSGREITAGNDQFDVTKPIRVKMIPDEPVFHIRNDKDLHGGLPKISCHKYIK